MVVAKNCFKVMKSKVRLMPSEDIVASSQSHGIECVLGVFERHNS